jgi:hypothetical protein
LEVRSSIDEGKKKAGKSGKLGNNPVLPASFLSLLKELLFVISATWLHDHFLKSVVRYLTLPVL